MKMNEKLSFNKKYENYNSINKNIKTLTKSTTMAL